jgi:hypothetical protein
LIDGQGSVAAAASPCTNLIGTNVPESPEVDAPDSHESNPVNPPLKPAVMTRQITSRTFWKHDFK